VISGDEQGVADQIGFDVVEPQNVQPHIPQTREKADFGATLAGKAAKSAGTRSAVRQSATGERAVYGHRLRRVLDSASYSQAPLRAQRMIGQAVSAAAAADMLRIPFHDLVEQAHAAVVGNIPFDPGVV
jgi:hypothetical protein